LTSQQPSCTPLILKDYNEACYLGANFIPKKDINNICFDFCLPKHLLSGHVLT
jgi:hypothetical protein